MECKNCGYCQVHCKCDDECPYCGKLDSTECEEKLPEPEKEMPKTEQEKEIEHE